MASDLRDYLRTLESAGPRYFAEVKKPLSPRLEPGVLQHKLAKQGRYPALYCRNISGSRLPLVVNTLATYEMLGMALGISPERQDAGGRSLILEEFRRRKDQGRTPVQVTAARSPVQEVVLRGDEADLGLLPIGWHAERNPAPYVATGVTVLKDPDRGTANCGIYRMQVMGRDRLACMIIPRPGKRGHEIAQRYRQLGRPMEAAVFIGHHPLVIAGAVTVGPPFDEWARMGALTGEPLELTRGATVDLPVPARAEIAIEGVIDTGRMEREGPFSETSGLYGEGMPCYVIRVTAITMRKDAIYHDMHPTHQDGGLWGILPRLSGILERARKAVPGVKSVYLGPEGSPGKGLIYISLEKQAEDDPVRAGEAALNGDPQGKVAVVVDDEIDACDEREVLWAVGVRRRDAPVIISTSDWAYGPGGGSPGVRAAAKLVIDATKPLGAPSPMKVSLSGELWRSMRTADYIEEPRPGGSIVPP
jgi:2,5-furandicarboxylate decarboxylase 1